MSGVAALLNPERVAVVGVSADPGKHGARVAAHLRRLGYSGDLWGVNPNRPELEGLAVVASLEDLPKAPDVVVSALPAAATIEVVRQAGAIGAEAVIVFAGGFAEAADGGARLQAELVETAQASGVRVLGPNSGGVIRPSRGLAMSFLTCLDRPTEQIRTGTVGVVTQSGGTGSYLHNLAAARGGGLAASISTGNEADIHAADALRALVELDDVRAIGLVLEAVRNGPAFLEALEFARTKLVPLVVCRIGTSDHGQQMMSTHTGAMAQPVAVLEGVLDARGVTVAETPAEMLEVAELLAHVPPAPGNRAAIVTHSGGLAILLADLAAKHDLDLPQPGSELHDRLVPLLDLGVANNPLDMGAIIGGPQRFTDVAQLFLESDEYDSVLAVTSAHPPAHTAARVARLLELATDKPLIHLWMAGDLGADGLARLRAAAQPITEEPRAAMRALAAICRRADLVEELEISPPLPVGAARSFPNDLTEYDAKQLLSDWGIPTVAGTLVSSADEAAQAATELGFPVAVKVSSPDVVHKGCIGGVVLAIKDADGAAAAYEHVLLAAQQHASGVEIRGALVERYRPGAEAIIGAVLDETFGPVVLAGVGGSLTESLGAMALAPAPVTAVAAYRLIRRSGAERLLSGGVGSPPDFHELADHVSLLSHRFAEHAEVLAEVEVNPLIWTDDDWEAADAVVRVRRD